MPGRPRKADYALPLGERLFLTYREAAALSGLAERSIREMVHNGELPAVTMGGARRIARKALEALAER